MEQPYIGFYRSRVRMFLKIILYVVITAILMFPVFYVDSAVAFMVFSLLALTFFILIILSIIDFMRDKPYLRFMETYMVLFPESFLELKVYYDDIDFISITETNLQKYIKVQLKNEETYYEQLSSLQILYFGQNKLLAFPMVLIHYKSIDKNVRHLFFSVMEDVIALTEGKIDSLQFNYLEEKDEREEISSGENMIDRLDPYVLTHLRFDVAYFKSAYLISLLYFAIFGILSYFLMESVEYLFLSIMNFFTYPFARVIADLMGLQKLKKKLNRQRGLTLHLYRMLYSIEIILFHISFLLSPLGILYLLVLFFVLKFKAKYPEQDDT